MGGGAVKLCCEIRCETILPRTTQPSKHPLAGIYRLHFHLQKCAPFTSIKGSITDSELGFEPWCTCLCFVIVAFSSHNYLSFSEVSGGGSCVK